MKKKNQMTLWYLRDESPSQNFPELSKGHEECRIPPSSAYRSLSLESGSALSMQLSAHRTLGRNSIRYSNELQLTKKFSIATVTLVTILTFRIRLSGKFISFRIPRRVFAAESDLCS